MTAFTNYFWKILIKKNLRRWWLFLPPGTQFCIWHQDKSKHTQVQQEPSRTTTTEARTVLISISRLVPDGFFFFYFLEGGTSFIFLISLDFSIKNTHSVHSIVKVLVTQLFRCVNARVWWDSGGTPGRPRHRKKTSHCHVDPRANM